MNSPFLPVAAALLCASFYSAAADEGTASKKVLLKDKTLVVWVSPSSLTQRGGSALTIEDTRNHFDAMVLGELEAEKWMAGSDQLARTERGQSEFVKETAGRGTFVQMAIVYRGREITVYREGTIYSRHVYQSQPQAFSQNAFVLMGKRHRQQGDVAHFGGAIDDARIYDRALNAEEIRQLRPNQAGEFPPWAWWNFENGDAAEQTGRFDAGALTGGAVIWDGKLILDGRTGNFLARGKHDFVIETPTRPSNPPADWLTFHLAHPGPGEGMPGDPNCAFYWKGRYHLHYIYTHEDGFSFAHVSSTDLLHWKWHPATLTPPNTNHGMFSGTGFFTKEGRPAIIYHGEGSGRNQIAIALDDELERWTKPVPLEPTILPGQNASVIAHWDPDAWLDGDQYYALSGGSPGSGKPTTLFRSKDLKQWDYLGLFLTHDLPGVARDEDISCPNFFPLGGKHMLLCISHNKGCRYYLGQWKGERFEPETHARMNWRATDFFAPESVLAADGRRVMWAWCNLGKPQTAIQSLPRELSLPADGILRIAPLRELRSLRLNEEHEEGIALRSPAPYSLRRAFFDNSEWEIVFQPSSASRVGLTLPPKAGVKPLPIMVDRTRGVLVAGEIEAPLAIQPGEEITLRVFVDRNMVEVFANDKQAVVVSFDSAGGEASRLNLHSEGGEAATAASVKSWVMSSIY